MLFAPLEGWRRVEVTDRRTKTGWAEVVQQLVDVDYPFVFPFRSPPHQHSRRSYQAAHSTTFTTSAIPFAVPT